MNSEYWLGRKVLITGHTGFKGSWLTLWLRQLGANLIGFDLPSASDVSLYQSLQLGNDVVEERGDIGDLHAVRTAVERHAPEVIFHLAAQPLVRASYAAPLETLTANVMGTAHLLEAARQVSSVRSVIVVTSDKCYSPHEGVWSFREDDRLGGHDPYSASKACAELVTESYRRSFFFGTDRTVGVATVRAGNVIGGGDWSRDRLVPDAMRAFLAGEELVVRSPTAIRPWQHVLEPIRGYLMLAERLHANPQVFGRAWNFGPDASDSVTVAEIAQQLVDRWPGAKWRAAVDPHALVETHSLRLDCGLAMRLLNWHPRLTLSQALDWTVDWYRALAAGANLREVATQQLARYQQVGCSTLEHAA